MHKQSSVQIPYIYRPYDFPSHFPVLAFMGDYWKTDMTQPEFLHFHNALELGYCLDGEGFLIHEHLGRINYGKGDFCLIFPHTPHITTAKDTPASWEYLYTEPKQLLKADTIYSVPLWQIFYMQQKICPLIRKEENPLLYYLLTLIFDEFHDKRILYQNVVRGLFISLFAELNRLALNTELSNCSGREGAYSYICNALSFIYENYNKQISIRDISLHCCISESHFRRLFHSIVGTSPMEYIQHYRIQQSCHWLHLNQEPINIIARKAGYSSLSSFNRQFQQYMHLSPSEWREKHLMLPYKHEILSYNESDTKHIFRF